MSIFGDLASEAEAIGKNLAEQTQQAEFLRSLARDPAGTWDLVNIVSKWGDHAPTLPAGAILGLAHAGIGPDGPMGQTIIRQGVPALLQPPGALDKATQAMLGPAGPVGPPEQQINPDFAPVGAGNYSDQAPASADLPNVAGAVSDALGQTSASLNSIGGAIGNAAGAVGNLKLPSLPDPLADASNQMNEQANLNRQAVGGPLGSAVGQVTDQMNTAAQENRQAISGPVGTAVGAVQQAVQPTNQLGYQAESTASGGSQSPAQVQAMGIGSGQSAQSIYREAGAVGSSSTELTTVPLKVAMTALFPNGFTEPLTGTKVTTGSIAADVNPGQFPIYQQIAHGKSLGTGWFPGGPATAAALADQRKAGMVGGHALTYGRVLADTVFQPGSTPSTLVSGLIDGAVSLKFDPLANALKYGSQAFRASRAFAPLDEATATHVAQYLVDNANTSDSMTGLNAWAGSPETDLVGAVAQKVKASPGDAMNVAQRFGIGDDKGLMRSAVAHRAGLFHGIRPFVHPQTNLQYLSSPSGDKMTQWLADNPSFSAIRSKLGDEVPVRIIADLRNASTKESVRAIIANELGPTIANKMRSPDGPFGFQWFRSPDNTRLFSQIPKESYDTYDANQSVQTAERYFAMTGVPTAKADPVLQAIASAPTPGARGDAILQVGDVIRDDLVEHGVPRPLATKLTRNFSNQWRQAHTFNTDDVGQAIQMPGIAVDGEGVPMYGSHLEAELARFIPPVPDLRALRQASSPSRQLLRFWNDGYLTDPESLDGGLARKAHQIATIEAHISDNITGAFKIGVLSAPRVAMRITVEEQLAAAVSGIDTILRHPLSTIAILLARKAEVNPLTGGTFADELTQDGSQMLKAVGSVASQNPNINASIDRAALKAFVDYTKDDAPYLRSWAGEISILHKDTLGREVSRVLLDPTHVPAGMEDSGLTGLDAVKEWYANGAGNASLANLRDAQIGWGSHLLNNRQASDLYVDSVRDRAMVKTGGDPTLLDAAANGTGFNWAKANQGPRKAISRDLINYLRAHKDDLGPTIVKGRPPLDSVRESPLNHAMDWWMGKILDTPSRVLTKIPFWKQWSYKEIQRIMPYMTEEAQQFALKNAAEDGMKLTHGVTTGYLEADAADTIVKTRTLARMKDYLYYPGDKTTAEDMLRNLSPFAPAWKSVVKRWSKLALEHPQIIRRGQQIGQELHDHAFSYKDPQTGKEVVSFAGPNWVKALTGATGFTLEGPLQGLNLVGNGLPGAGLGAQALAGATIPNVGGTAAIRQFINPYGAPDFANALEPFFPGYFQRLQAGGFQGIPGSAALRYFAPRTPRQLQTVQDLQKQALATMVNSGAYNISDPKVWASLNARAKDQANRLEMLHGLVQFLAPTAPTYSAKITPPGYPTGLFIYKIATDYRNQLKVNKYDYAKTDQQFIAKYGYNILFATSPKNLQTVYGVPTAVDGEVWQNQHQSFVDHYKNVWGYFAPQGGAFSSTVYNDEVKKGYIKPLTLDDWAPRVENFIGSFIYDQIRKPYGAHITKDIQAYLDANKAKIAKEHPGYGMNLPDVGSRAKTDAIIAELGQAVQDPSVRQTPLASAISAYLNLRDQQLAAFGRKTLTGAAMAASRDYLFANGNNLVQQYPQFAPVWDSLFRREVVPQ